MISGEMTTIGPETDFQTVVDAFVAIKEDDLIALGVDLSPGPDGDQHVLFGLADDMYRVHPELAFRLANYMDHASRHGNVDHPAALRRLAASLRSIAQGLGYVAPRDN